MIFIIFLQKLKFSAALESSVKFFLSTKASNEINEKVILRYGCRKFFPLNEKLHGV
jgi:hypothetical protein